MKTQIRKALGGVAMVLGSAWMAAGARADTIAAGSDFGGAIDSTGVLRTWGDNAAGQLGLATATTPIARPARVAGTWTAVAMGSNFTLAIDNASALWAWGGNASGQLGNGTTASSSSPVKVTTLPAGSVVQAVAAGQSFSAALVTVGTDAGRIYAWGDNSFGELGQGTIQSAGIPVEVNSGTRRFLKIAATSDTALAIATDGTLWAWGLNTSGEAGQGNSTSTFTSPVQIGTAKTWTALAGGGLHVLALQGTKLFAWGHNGFGEVGNGTLTNATAPVQIVTPAQTWASIGAGEFHSLAITSAGAMFGWGENPSGQIDLPVTQGGQIIFKAPQPIGGSLAPWAIAKGGDEFTLARTVSGNVFAVGDDSVGELGNGLVTTTSSGSFTPSFSAVLVSGVTLVALAPVVSTTLGVDTDTQPASVTVTNTDSGTLTTAFVVSIYLSADGALDGNSILLDSVTESGPLGPLGSITVPFPAASLAIPGVAPGSYELISQVSLVGAANPLVPANGNATTVTLAGPQLTLGSFVFPDTTSVAAAGGGFGNVSYQLTNNGAGAVPVGTPVTIQVFLSTTTTFNSATAVLLDEYAYTGGIAAGGTVLLPSPSHAINLPQGVQNGVYSLLFLVDGVEGAATTLNAESVAVGALDASVTAPSLANTTLGANTTLPATNVSVNNPGGFAIPAGTVVNLFLSADGQVDLSSTLLGTITISAQIPAGGSRTVTFNGISIPSLAPGSYSLFSQVILPTGLIDLNLANNVAGTPVSLQRPELTISGLTLPSSVLDLNVANTLPGVTFTLSNTTGGAVAPGTGILIEAFLSPNGTLNASTDPRVFSEEFTGGLGAVGSATASSVAIAPFTVTIPPGTVGGNYTLIFVANRDGNVAENDSTLATASRFVVLQESNSPGPALDFGSFTMSAAQWFSVTDQNSPDGQAFQSPALSQGQQATLSLNVTGPTTLQVPWMIEGGATDSVAWAIDGGTPVTLAGFQPAYQPQSIPVPAGSHTVVWTYTQNTTSTASFARIDLDLPNFTTSGDGSWIGVANSSSPVGGTFAQTPVLQQGQQATLQVNATGPALTSFWWRTASVPGQDNLAFFIDGQAAQLPTTALFATPATAVISGTTSFANVAFLLTPGPHVLSWTFTQNSTQTDSAGFVAGLEVLTPIPATNPANRLTDPVAHAAVPPSNLDFAVTNVVSPTGTYLLDDSNGTGVLPVSLTVVNEGADFVESPAALAANLEIYLSTSPTFGDADDIDLGNFANFDAFPSGNQVAFDGELDLPFNIPDGNYFLLLAYSNPGTQGEFTLANNTAVLGPGYVITSAPDLAVNNFQSLSPDFPYNPEESVFVTYNIINTGLGSVLPSQPFNMQLQLMAISPTATDPSSAVVIATFPAIAESLFLPEISAQFPNGGTAPVTQIVSLPNIRDILVGLGLVPAGTPIDSASVSANAAQLNNFTFFFQTFVDSGDAIVESDKSNNVAFQAGFNAAGTIVSGNFSIVPLISAVAGEPPQSNIGQYFGQAAWQGFINGDPTALPLTGAVFDNSPGATATDKAFTSLVLNYATGQALAGSPQSLFQPLNQNGFPSLVVPPSTGTASFLTETFDFNLQANDIAIDVQASSDLVTFTTLVTLAPPYFGTSGAQSLSGFGGLVDNPFVLAVQGNTTDVEQASVAQLTVRDDQPAASFGSRFMRLNIRPLVAAPPAPDAASVAAAFDTTINQSVLSWTTTAVTHTVIATGVTTTVSSTAMPTIADPFGSGQIAGGAYVVELASATTPNTFVSVGSTSEPTSTNVATSTSGGVLTTTTVGNYQFNQTGLAAGNYLYRLRAITVGGVSAATTAGFTVPTP